MESVKEHLPVSVEEQSQAWGPGIFPWHMVFQYDPEWAQWKMSFSPQGSSSNTLHSDKTAGTHKTTGGSLISNRATSQPTSSSPSQSSAHKADGTSAAGGEQHINLFWDHWRLKQMRLQVSDTTAVEVEKESARGGRSYADAHADEGSETHPSHLLISLP